MPPPLSVPRHPISPTASATSHPEKHLKSLGPACNKGWEASWPGEAVWAVGSASPSGRLPQAPHSPPTCPAASHAKDHSNSPLGLSQRPLAIDGEMGSPPSPLTSLFYIQVCFLLSLKIPFGTFSS